MSEFFLKKINGILMWPLFYKKAHSDAPTWETWSDC